MRLSLDVVELRVDGVAGDDLVEPVPLADGDRDVGVGGPPALRADCRAGVLLVLGDGLVVHEPLDQGGRVGVEGHALVGQGVSHPRLGRSLQQHLGRRDCKRKKENVSHI